MYGANHITNINNTKESWNKSYNIKLYLVWGLEMIPYCIDHTFGMLNNDPKNSSESWWTNLNNSKKNKKEQDPLHYFYAALKILD